MPDDPMLTSTFILEAFDTTLWCPVAQAMFEVPDLDVLRSILGPSAVDDPELADEYFIEQTHELAMIGVQFGIFIPSELICRSDIELTIYKRRDDQFFDIPYLAHGGYELPLLLAGRKKLAKMYHEYPPLNFAGEESFDRWVNEGVLHKEIVMERFEQPVGIFEGLRTAYYTLQGEEWRIPATKLIWRAARQSGGWNEHFERLEGMLYGYEDWQNDWWIENLRKKGRWSRRQAGA